MTLKYIYLLKRGVRINVGLLACRILARRMICQELQRGRGLKLIKMGTLPYMEDEILWGKILQAKTIKGKNGFNFGPGNFIP